MSVSQSPTGVSGVDNSLHLGSHIILDFQGCNDTILRNVESIESAIQKTAQELGATTLSSEFHSFEPQGVTGVLVLAESHITIHTWPEYGFAAVDIFACGDMSFKDAILFLQNALGAQNIEKSQNIKRGTANTIENDGAIDYSSSNWEKQYQDSSAWGLEAAIDVYQCNPEIIRDAQAIKNYVLELCNLIDMKRFGDTQVVHFGEDEKVAGYSMTQLIETSLISGHFANATNASYINAFSCKYFDPRTAAEFTTEYFKGKYYKLNINMRDDK